MATYEFNGTVKKIGELQTFPSGFTKRELVVSDGDPRYPQEIPFSFTKERANLLEQFKEGDPVRVSFDIRGREYNGRYFVDLNGWRIERGDTAPGGAPVAPAAQAAAPVPPAPAAPAVTDMAGEDDPLPF